MQKRNLIILSALLLIFLWGCSAEVDPSVANTPAALNAIRYEFIIALVGFGSGVLCIVAGITLTILGFTGDITWIVEAGGFSSKLINASPGVLLMVIGCFIMIKTKYNVKIK